MKAQITSTLIDTTDRTVDLTVAISSDDNTLLATRTDILVPIDDLTLERVRVRLLSLIQEIQRQRSAIPYTQAQIDAMLVGMTVIEPD